MKWCVYMCFPIVLVAIGVVWMEPSNLIWLLIVTALVVLSILFIILIIRMIRTVLMLYHIDANRKVALSTEETDQAIYDEYICFVPSF